MHIYEKYQNHVLAHFQTPAFMYEYLSHYSISGALFAFFLKVIDFVPKINILISFIKCMKEFEMVNYLR